jgi:hypothetical protein
MIDWRSMDAIDRVFYATLISIQAAQSAADAKRSAPLRLAGVK